MSHHDVGNQGRVARALGSTLVIVAVMLLAAVPTWAEQAQRAEMDNVGHNWVVEKVAQTGSWAGVTNPTVGEGRELSLDGRLLGMIYDVEPNGYVVVPALKELPPVQMYSDDSRLDENQEGGPLQMIREILAARLDAFEQVYGSLDYDLTSDGLFAASQKQAWERFEVTAKDFRIDISQGAMSQGGPLCTTEWHQGSPYNLYCPTGADGRTVVGCVATAMVQVMAYWQWPNSGIGSSGYMWEGDYSCDGLSSPGAYLTADYSDTYDWANIVDNCNGGCTTAQQLALAELSYEAGVALEMDYGSCGSGAYTGAAAQMLPAYFKYSTDAHIEYRNAYSQQGWFDLAKSEIDAGRVIQYRINSHSIVCDGYRDDYGSLEYHMNYGWAEEHTAWYVLDNLYCYWISGEVCPYDEEYMIVGIHPQLDPVLSYAGQTMDDGVTGDGNGRATAGETVQFFLSAANNGNDATNTTVTVTSSDPYVTITGGTVALDPLIVWGDTGTAATPVEVQVAAGCPDPHLALFEVLVEADGGFTANGSFYVFIGNSAGLVDDMESGSGGWSHSALTGGYVDQWHQETYRKNSGTTSWKFGGSSSANYADQGDGALLTPPLLLPPDAQMTFWHWISAEDNGDGYTAWDGGVVTISDGAGWAQVEPEGGYPFTIVDNVASPFAGGTPCFSDSHTWQKVTFDLSAYSGVAQVMFRFGSDGNTNYEGWYIDDIEICNTPAGTGVAVEPLTGCVLTYDEVTASGNTFVSASVSGPTLPSGYGAVAISEGLFFEPTTSATFVAPVTICFEYDEGSLNRPESGLRMYQYSGGEWTDLSATVDGANNRICGEVSEFSTLVVVEQLSCCVGRVGDANNSGDDEPTLGDVSALIDMLFLTENPIACLAEGDANQSGGVNPTDEDITLGDISTLIDYLFITGSSLVLSNCL